MALALGGVTIVSWSPPAEAAPVSIVVDKSAPASVLVGAPITYSVTASNPGGDGDADFQYNLTFRDVLPAGVKYVSTSAPAGLGDPQQIAEIGANSLPTGRTILIWSNVADLPDGSDVTLTYRVQPDADVYPVGDQVQNGVTGYASGNERALPKFDAAGSYVTTAAIQHADASATTAISAIQLEKSEPSSEHELVRGVHDHTTTYTLKATNNGMMPTTDVKVVDYLPAGLEFLGCGQVDNSVTGFEEYPGSGRLTSTPLVSAGDGCLAPSSVTTVNTDLPADYPAGVYTRVEWSLPNLTANGSQTITYRAGIPLHQNVMPAAGFVSTANLQNNTGASTRETTSEIGLTNRAVASGIYRGVNAQGQRDFAVSATASVTVTSEDIALEKSIEGAAAFSQGGEAEYRLLVRTGEYVDASDIVLVDTMPDGLCPSDAPADTYTPAALAQAGAGECRPSGANEAIASVDFAAGVFVVTFQSLAVTAADASATVSYHVQMRETYNAADEQTSAGDSYTNKVALTGTTRPIATGLEPGTQVLTDIKDASEATIASSAPKLDKRILRNTAANHSCADTTWTSRSTGNWFNDQSAAGDAPFTPGSRVCFQVRVSFPTTSSTRLPVVTDYLPDNLRYEAGSFALVDDVNTAPMTLAQADRDAIEAAFAKGTASLRPGTEVGGTRYVAKGEVFAFRLSAIVQSNPKAAVDVQGNLAKLRWTSHSGRVSSLRDTADFQVPPVPPVAIEKQVAKTSATPLTYADSQPVVHGDKVRFRIGVTNQGSTPVADLDVWDVLPAPFTCSSVSDITDGGTCTDPGATGHPTFAGSSTSSAIRWVLPASVVAGGTNGVTYDVTVPTTTSVGTRYENAAYVRSFTTPTNRDDAPTVRHHPAANIDSSVAAGSQDAPAATDVASVALPKVVLSKSNTTGVDATGNTLVGQAVPGETVTYTVQAKIPARTTVYNGVLTDPMPTDLTFVSATAGYSAVNADPAVDELPAGTVFDPSTAKLTLPTTFTNATDSVQVFQVTIEAKVAAKVTDDIVRTNTATFKSRTQLAPSGVLVTDVTASTDVTPVHPAPAISKALTTSPAQSSTVRGGDSRQYVLKASNGAGKPSLYDSRVVDCVPTGLVVTTLPQEASQAPTVPADACSAVAGTGTTIIWETGTIDAGATTSLTYTVQVSPDAAAGQVYRNTATLTGSSLADGARNADNEQVIGATGSLPLTVPSGTITKAIADSTLAVGERAEYTLTASLPVKAQYFNASMSDTLPAGLDPASVVTTSVECTDAAGPCALPSNGAAMTASGQTVGWSFGDLASSDNVRTIKVKFSALVADNCVGTQTSCNTISRSRSNTAGLRWDLTNKAEPASASTTQDKSATSTAVVFKVQEPKTAVTKSVSSTTPAPGDTFTYSVVASNAGGTDVSDAHAVVVKDVVPAGVVIDATTISGGGTYDADTRTITWNVSLLTAAAGANHARTFTYDARLAASNQITGAGLKNTATITAFQSTATGGRSYVGPSASATVTPKLPHTSVTKRVVGSDVSYVGEPQTFEIVVTNDGESPAYDIDVADVLPRSWQLGAAQVKVGDAPTVTVPPTTDDAGNPQTVTWDDLAPSGLAVGKTIVITYVATPLPGALTDAGAGSAKAHTNTVTINAEDRTGRTGSGKGSYSGGPATATARIHSADLAVAKTAVGAPIAGDSFSWKIQVTNHGDDPAVGPIVVTDTIPAHVTSYALSGTGWTCTSTTTVWTCTRPGPIADDGSAPDLTATGTIDADLANGADLVNTATVSGRTHDPVSSNDRSTATVGVTTLADLKIAKSLTGIITAGQSATWTLDVRNLGPSTSRGPITVKDTLPDGATFISAAGEGWTCDEQDGVVTCERTTDLPASGASAAGQITVVAKISAAQKAAVVNTATVSGTTTEPSTTTAKANSTDTVSTTPTRTADLFLQKSLVSATAAVPGTDLTYELEVTNNGPSTATGVTITDTLPDYMTYVRGGNASWDCSADGQDVVCELDGSLGVADDVASVEIVAKVASDRTGPIVNSAAATATEDPAGSTDDDTNTPTLKSDLTIAKSHAGDATAGKSITYDVTVQNDGPSDTAGPIVVEDTVPTGMTYASMTGAGWACDEEDGTVTCAHAGGLANGASRTLALTFEVAVDAGPASVANNVTVDGPNTDPEIGNSTAVDPTDIIDDANLTITKTASLATTPAGTRSSWAIDVVNEGPSTADNVSVSDLLPAGLTVVSISGTGWTCDETALTCTRATLAPGAAPSITVVTEVFSGVASGTKLVNAAEVSTSTEDEDDVDDNDSSDGIGVTTSADLTLDKTHTGTPVAGQSFSFDLVGHNAGPSDARGPITISDTLPAGMTYISANQAWSCLAAPVSSSGQEVLCTLVSGGPIIAGDDVPTLTMAVDVQSDQSGATLVNTAEIDSSTPDPTAGNNDDTDTVVPTDAVDLTVTKSHVGPVRIGDELTFTIGVHNDGPSQAREVTVTDALPKGLTFVRAHGTGWTCASGACVLDKPLAPAASAEPLTVDVEVAPEAYPDVTNVATVATSSHETKPADNEAKDKVDVPAQVDLSVVKKAAGDLRVGEQAGYSLTVHNAGPTADPGSVTVTDQLPAGLTYVGAEAAGWECGSLAQLVTCTRDGDLPAAATETIALTVDVGAAAYPTVSNSARVSSPAEDTDPDNNTSTTTSPVAGRAALALAKSLGSQDGSTAVWTIAVRNTGPTETTAPLVVVDKLPEGLAFRGAAGDGWACATPASVVTCTYAGALPVGMTTSMEVTTKITVDDGSEIVNVATVEGGDSVVRSAALSDDAKVTAPAANADDADGADEADDPDGHAGGLMPDTGGVAFWLLLAGLALVVAGGALVTRRRRPSDQQL